MLHKETILYILALSWMAYSAPGPDATITPATSTTKGPPSSVLIVDDSTYRTATANIVNVQDDTTTFKLLTVTVSERGVSATFTPMITQAPSSYGIEQELQTSISGAGKLTIKARND